MLSERFPTGQLPIVTSPFAFNEKYPLRILGPKQSGCRV